MSAIATPLFLNAYATASKMHAALAEMHLSSGK